VEAINCYIYTQTDYAYKLRLTRSRISTTGKQATTTDAAYPFSVYMMRSAS